MAVAAPARRSSAASAPAPSRTAPPRPKRAPARPAPSRAPARRKPTRAKSAAPARRAPAPARRPKPQRSSGGQLIPLAVGRTAATVRHLPDSGLVVRMTRGRAWIAVLGLLLVGIVALNVVTLSFAATSGKIDAQNTDLGKELSVLGGREAQMYSTGRIRSEGAAQGLTMSTIEEPHVIVAGPNDVARAAQRLAAAGG
jgi:hypothetical protein